MQNVRSIDPTECWVRHIVRGESTDTGAKQIGRVYFIRDDVVSGTDGLNGRQGWQQAEATLMLSDDGSFTLTLPNAAGDDGVLHRRRFRVLTDEAYEPGEEWLEFWTDADTEEPLFVGTPTDYEKSASTVVIKGADVTVVLAGCLSTDVDVWDGTAPADVIGHYSRLSVLAAGQEWEEPTYLLHSGAVDDDLGLALTDVDADCWVAHARLTNVIPPSGSTGYVYLRMRGGGANHTYLRVRFNAIKGVAVEIGDETGGTVSSNAPWIKTGPIDLRLVAHYDRLFGFINGQLALEMRRPPTWTAPTEVEVEPVRESTGSMWVFLQALSVTSSLPFLARGDSAVLQRRLPGLPPGTGLRGRYWNVASIFARFGTHAHRIRRLFPLGADSEPGVDRLDPQVNFPTGTANYPPDMPGAYAVRWTGAIYLDLATSDRKVRLTNVPGHARIYIGYTLRGSAEAVTTWWDAGLGGNDLTTPSLRALLGEEEAGWYPILIEHVHSTNAAGVVLQDTAVDGTGTPTGAGWTTVPQSRLSPLGVVDDHIRNTPHRTVLGDVAQTFGYQWRLEPRSLESGEFPAQIVAQSLVGRQTAVTIDDKAVGTDAQVSGAAGDVADAIVADAAGIADPTGAGQLSAQVIDFERATEHLALRQAYESLSDITEAPLLLVRIDSLLALRSSPNEQVGVRPRGQRDLVDTFPLSGILAKMKWKPGDGALLDLEQIDVKDTSPRQMTTVAWPLRPDSLGAPTVGFRQRPRNAKDALKRLRAGIFGPRRTYQGQIAILTGAPGGADSTGIAANGVNDPYSRVPLPTNLDDIVRAVLSVQALAGSGWRIELNAVDLATDGAVTANGRYDITRAIEAVGSGRPLAYARLIGGSSGSYLITLEVHVRV